MTMTEDELVDECYDLTYVEFLILYHADGKKSKTQLMNELIEKYGDIIEHGPYLYGEYSDDIDEGIENLCCCGIMYRNKYKLERTESGNKILEIMLSNKWEFDEDVEKAIKRVQEAE